MSEVSEQDDATDSTTNQEKNTEINFVELGDINKSEQIQQEVKKVEPETQEEKQQLEAEAREAFIDASEIRPPHTEESMIAHFESYSKEFPRGQTFTDKIKEVGEGMQKPLQEMNKNIKEKKGWLGKLLAAAGGIGWLVLGALYLGGTVALGLVNTAARIGIGGGQK